MRDATSTDMGEWRIQRIMPVAIICFSRETDLYFGFCVIPVIMDMCRRRNRELIECLLIGSTHKSGVAFRRRRMRGIAGADMREWRVTSVMLMRGIRLGRQLGIGFRFRIIPVVMRVCRRRGW